MANEIAVETQQRKKLQLLASAGGQEEACIA